MRQDVGCVNHPDDARRTSGSTRGRPQWYTLPTRTRVHAEARQPLDLSARLSPAPRRPRMMRMPADWWDSPTAVVCPLSRGPQSARAARRLPRNTLRAWGLASLAGDAETIVGEFVANAVTHATAMGELPPRKQAAENLGLRLFRRTGEVICAVLDPSDSAP